MFRRNLSLIWGYFVFYPISGALGWFLFTPPYNLCLAVAWYLAAGVLLLLVIKERPNGR